MSRIGKMISFTLLLLLVLSLLPPLGFEARAAGFSVQAPATSVSGAYTFTALPGVYEMGDGYAVIWATSFQGTGYIRYTYQGKQYTVYDQKNGIVRTGDTVHVVKVPHEHLLGNSYTVYSQVVTGHNYAVTNYSTTISAGPITLKAYDGGTEDFDLLVLTDTHGKPDWTKTVASQFTQQDPDLVVFSGDVTDSLTSKADIELMFHIMGSTTGGRYPIVYARGNHEIRGKYSTALLDYFPTETGEFYYDFTYGPLYAVVLDTGEDKMDSHEYYGNLANFQEYHAKQEAWLRTLRKDDSATFRLGIYHIARIHNLSRTGDNLYDYTDSIGHLGLQLAVTGHFHNCSVYDRVANNGTSIRHESLICGGYESDQATMVTLDRSDRAAHVTSRKSSGAYGSFQNRSVAFSQYIGSVPDAMEEPERGLANQFNNHTPNSGIALVTQPAVFETGGDWYNILWKTQITDPKGQGSTGYVKYTYNGQTYQVFDEVGGYRRTYDDYHTVRVPKEHLNNNTYQVGSFLMTYSATASGARYYTAGGWVESGSYLFENRSDDTTPTLLACPDLEIHSTDTAPLSQAAKAAAALGTSPAYILLNGNTLGQSLDTGADFTNLIHAAATLSGSIHPVILSRSFSECRGTLAPNLQRYLPTATGEFYYTVDLGDYTLVNLDTAEDDPDNQRISYQGDPNFLKYGGRVFFDRLRQEQQDWLRTLPSGKLVPISSRPLADHDQTFGTDYEGILREKGAVAAIAGHPDDQPARETLYTFLPAGYGSGVEVGTLTLGDGCGYAALSTGARTTVKLSDGSPLTHTPTAPDLSGTVYTLTRPEHLHWLSQQVQGGNDFAGYTLRMEGDIDLQLVPFTPIGGNDAVSSDSNTTSKAFAGIFDGNGFAIRNLNILSQSNNVGLFGALRGGKVMHLTLSGGTVTGSWYVGGVAGFASEATVEDCYVDLTLYSPDGSKVGGIVGFATEGTAIVRCANYGHLMGGLVNGSIGGILGQWDGSRIGSLSHCYNRGSISNHGTSGCSGGLIGYISGGGCKVTSSYNAGTVTGFGTPGGIIGSLLRSSKVTFSTTYFVKTPTGATTGTGKTNSWNSAGGSGTFTAYAPSSMQTESFAEKLGGRVYTYVARQNDGYPVHWNAIHYGQTSHSYDTQTIVAPNCLEGGRVNYHCACGDQYTAAVPASGHSYIKQVTQPTCTQSGYTVYTCSTCADRYTDDTTPATGHSYHSTTVPPTCTMGGYTDYVCTACGDGYAGDHTPALGHQEVTIPGVDPQCTKTGLTEGSRCNRCHTLLVRQKEIPATGHRYQEAVTHPTCTEEGFTLFTCTGCDHRYTGAITQPLGHQPVTDKAVAPDCTQTGLTQGSHCSRCEAVLNKQETVPALGHDYEYRLMKAPSFRYAGILRGNCTRCGKVRLVAMPLDTGNTYREQILRHPTCTIPGLKLWSWQDATYGEISFIQILPTTTHRYRYRVTKLPTPNMIGILTGTCTTCGQTIRTGLPPLTSQNYLLKSAQPGEIRCLWKNTHYGVITFTTSGEIKKIK